MRTPILQTLLARLRLWQILLLGLVLRVGWLVYANPVPVSDFAGYQSLASTLLRYGQLGYPQPTAYRLPGYPAFLALFMWVSAAVPWLAFANILLSLAIVYLVYLLGCELTDSRETGLLAALLAAVYPTLVFFAPILASEHLFTVLLYAGVWVFVADKFAARLYLRSILAGALFGLATLTRGELLFYIPILGLYFFAPFLANGLNGFLALLRPALFKTLAQILLMALVGGSILLPWYLRNQALIGPGAGMSTSGGMMFYFGHHDQSQDWDALAAPVYAEPDEAVRSKIGFQKGLAYVASAPILEQGKQVVLQTLRLFAPNDYPVLWSVRLPTKVDGSYTIKPLPGRVVFQALTMAAYVVLALLGLYAVLYFKYIPFKAWWIIGGLGLMNWFGYAVVFAATPRYRYTLEGLLCILAAAALWQLSQRGPVNLRILGRKG